MKLVVDTSTLIDLDNVDGLEVLPRLAEVAETLDVVLAECGDALADQVRIAGYQIVEVPADWMQKAQRFRAPSLSAIDALVLYRAHTKRHILVTSDGPLRKLADANGVEVHGAIWIVEQALSLDIVSSHILCSWLQTWLASNRRIPDAEIKRLRKLIKCN